MEEDFVTSPASTTSPVAFTQSTKNDNSTGSAPPQSSTSPPVSGPSGPPVNPRSCTTCRKRKVRCDKRHPCSNCSKAGTECIFPGPGRAPRRSRKPPDTELLARLRRLEGVVQNLGKGIDEDGEVEAAEAEARPVKAEAQERRDRCPDKNAFLGINKANGQSADPNGLLKEFGRLKVEGGRSRYVSNKFWVSMSDEVSGFISRGRFSLLSVHVLCFFEIFSTSPWISARQPQLFNERRPLRSGGCRNSK